MMDFVNWDDDIPFPIFFWENAKFMATSYHQADINMISSQVTTQNGDMLVGYYPD